MGLREMPISWGGFGGQWGGIYGSPMECLGHDLLSGVSGTSRFMRTSRRSF